MSSTATSTKSEKTSSPPKKASSSSHQQHNITESKEKKQMISNNKIGLEKDKELIDEKSLLTGTSLLSKEDDEGNVEYKWKLVNLSEDRFKHLVTQMKYRLSEGQGECIYEIGINDDGFPLGLSEDEYKETLSNIEKMANELQATVSIICEKQVSSEQSKKSKKNMKQQSANSTATNGESEGSASSTSTNGTNTTTVATTLEEKRWVGEVLVRKFGEEEYLDVRIAVCGNVDSGKSTLIGVLTRGQLDNGRGLARASVFIHKHELSTGRTSSVSHQIMGFDSKGDIVNYSQFQSPSWQDIIEKSSKVCTFIDLAGHEKYLKTTVYGMTSSQLDYGCVVVGSNMGISKMSKEHIGLLLALKIPMFFCVTKVDICPENVLKQTLETIHKILKLPGVRKLPYHVKTEDDVVTCAKNLASDRIAPIFLLSSVTGENLPLLHKFLNLLPVRKDWESLIDKPAEYVVDQTFFVAGVGTVVSGIVQCGSISVNDKLMLGPDSNGQFRSVVVKSIHCKRVNVKRAHAGQHASLALKKERRSGIRKGMVLVDDPNPKAVWEFEAECLVLYHSTTIKENYQPVVHCGCVRQTAKIVKMDVESLRTGEKAKVKFRFMFRPEYIRKGERLIFREGRTKGLGVISDVFE